MYNCTFTIETGFHFKSTMNSDTSMISNDFQMLFKVGFQMLFIFGFEMFFRFGFQMLFTLSF